MKLYLDDDSVARRLITLLRKAGHTVVLPVEVGTAQARDPAHLTYSARNSLVLLTRNHKHFEELHDLVDATGGAHCGILTVGFDDNPRHAMKPHDVANAIKKLEASDVAVSNQVVVLNHWK